MFKLKKKGIAVLSGALIFALSSTSVFGYAGLGDVKYLEETYIAPEVYYENQIATHSVNGQEHAYTIDVDLKDGVVAPYVFPGVVTNKYTLTNMIKWIKEEGYTVVAGINGGFYDMSNGVPSGLVMHGGKIKASTGSEAYALGFNSDGSAFIASASIGFTLTVNADAQKVAEIGYFNQPHGAAKALHMYNNQYNGSSTKTSGKNVEVVINTIAGNEPIVGGKIHGTVSAVFTDVNNSPVGSSQIVLSVPSDGAYAPMLSSIVVGDSIVVDVVDKTENNRWADATEAVGAHDLIALNGQVNVTANSVNPRTCVGIKADGNIMLFVVDGRQSTAKGLGLADVAKYMIDRGCVDVVNLDGGGSTTMAVRLPGDAGAARINSPSGGSERANSNGLFIVAKKKGTGTAENLHVYPLTTYIMPGATTSFNLKATDDMYNAVSTPSGVSFGVDSSLGAITTGGKFTAGSETGNGEVTVSSNNGASGSAKLNVVKNVSYYLSDTAATVKPGNTKDINVTAYWGYANVVTHDSLFTWSCDPNIGTIDQNGLFTAVNKTGVSGKIYVDYNGTQKTVAVQVGDPISFNDTTGHWAEQYITSLASRAIINGMGTGIFKPEDNVTRAQFVKIIASGIEADVSSAKATSFTDLKAGDWYVPYVNWAFENGIVKGITDTTFEPDSPITREQMAIMLVNFANYSNTTLPSTVPDYNFIDESTINSWAKASVDMVVEAGLMNGRPNGDFDPLGKATRAEAAKVLYVAFDLIGSLENNNSSNIDTTDQSEDSEDENADDEDSEDEN